MTILLFLINICGATAFPTIIDTIRATTDTARLNRRNNCFHQAAIVISVLIICLESSSRSLMTFETEKVSRNYFPPKIFLNSRRFRAQNFYNRSGVRSRYLCFHSYETEYYYVTLDPSPTNEMTTTRQRSFYFSTTVFSKVDDATFGKKEERQCLISLI